jgi:hypothetical protein
MSLATCVPKRIRNPKWASNPSRARHRSSRRDGVHSTSHGSRTSNTACFRSSGLIARAIKHVDGKTLLSRTCPAARNTREVKYECVRSS